MRKLFCLSAVAAIGLITTSGPVRAAEEKFPLEKLPKAVVDALKVRFPGAKLKAAEEEKDGDKIFYDVSLKHKGENYEVSVTPEGQITTYEKQIPAKDLPEAVTDALQSKYPKATYKLVEEVYKVKEKEEKLYCYEVALVTAKKKKVEVLVAPDGKILKATEEKAKAAPDAGTGSLDRIPAQVVADTVGGRAQSELAASSAIVFGARVAFKNLSLQQAKSPCMNSQLLITLQSVCVFAGCACGGSNGLPPSA